MGFFPCKKAITASIVFIYSSCKARIRFELSEVLLSILALSNKSCNPFFENNFKITSIPKSAWTDSIFIVFKNPLIVVRKTREAVQFYDKLILPSTTGTNKPIFTYKNISTDKEIRLCTFNVAVKSTKPVSLDMYKNSNLTAASWIAFDGSTTIQKDISATSYSGGLLVGGVDVPETGGVYISQEDKPLFFTCLPNETITIVLTAENSSDIRMRIRLEEI